MLGFDPAAPEADILPELPLEARWIHPDGTDLHRVENIHSSVDEIGNVVGDRPAGMKEHLDARFVDAFKEALAPRVEHAMVELGIDRRRGLGTEILTELNDIDGRSDGVEDLLKNAEVPLYERVEETIHCFRLGEKVDEKLVGSVEKLTPLEECCHQIRA